MVDMTSERVQRTSLWLCTSAPPTLKVTSEKRGYRENSTRSYDSTKLIDTMLYIVATDFNTTINEGCNDNDHQYKTTINL
jgi:hypothetical protein